jgi:hypothetical protein
MIFEKANLTDEEKITVAVNELTTIPDSSFQTNLLMWEAGIDALWNELTAEKLAALGTRAAALFEHSRAWAQFLMERATFAGDQNAVDRIASRVASLPPFTVNGDGTVTLDEAEERT